MDAGIGTRVGCTALAEGLLADVIGPGVGVLVNTGWGGAIGADALKLEVGLGGISWSLEVETAMGLSGIRR